MGTDVTEATALGIFITGLGAGGGSEDPAYEPKESYEPGTFEELLPELPDAPPPPPEAELEADPEVGPLVGAEYIS